MQFTSDNVCLRCVWWCYDRNHEVNECRRHPPSVWRREFARTVWPETKWHDWCGEFAGSNERDMEIAVNH